MSLWFFSSFDFLFLDVRTLIQNLSPRTNFKYMIYNFFHSILDTSGERLTIHISEIYLEEKERKKEEEKKIYFLKT